MTSIPINEDSGTQMIENEFTLIQEMVKRHSSLQSPQQVSCGVDTHMQRVNAKFV